MLKYLWKRTGYYVIREGLPPVTMHYLVIKPRSLILACKMILEIVLDFKSFLSQTSRHMQHLANLSENSLLVQSSTSQPFLKVGVPQYLLLVYVSC